MKKNRMIISFIPLMSVAFIVSCNKNGKLPGITSFEEKTPKAFLSVTNGAPSLTPTTTPINIYLINENSIPYVSIKDIRDVFLNKQMPSMKSDFPGYDAVTKDYVTTITNKANTSAKCVIDYKKQTMEFDDYIAFINNDKKSVNPLDIGLIGGRSFFANDSISSVEYVAPRNSTIIDFSKYSIPLFCKDNEGYIPLEVANNLLVLFSTTHRTYVVNKDWIIINNEKEIDLNNQLSLNKQIGAEFSDNYLKYCYNLNALTLDTQFGLEKRSSRSSPGKTIDFSKQNAYDCMKIDEGFTSKESTVANASLMKLINNYYDDGGHTVYSGASFIDDGITAVKVGPEYYHTIQETYLPLLAERIKQGLNPASTTGHADAIGDFQIYKDAEGQSTDTAFLTMDNFSGSDSTNYWANTINLVKYANEQLRIGDGKNVKKLVIDLSVNTGGTVFTGYFMSSWLTRGASHAKMYNPLTGAYGEYTYKADINGDSKFDDNDKLPTTVENVYVITSEATFSCGNLLSCDLKDYTTYTHFIGMTTGGGGAMVRGNQLSGYGTFYNCSSGLEIGRKDSKSDNFICNDNGVGPNKSDTKDMPIDKLVDLYDRDAIFNFIHKP